LVFGYFSSARGVQFWIIYTINEAVVQFRLSGDNITSQTDNLVLKKEATFEFSIIWLRKKGFF
jgi:hypothetical protein